MRINEKNQIGQPLISIIMPAYNCEKYIEDSIKSVLYQTYQNWELIVIDDKSKDNTYALLNKLKVQDNRIKVFQNERNMGVGQTRNRGVELANGQWIAFLDSD
ncbi:MAG: glycosyltransferase family 2 protein, partial [Lachnospiraceae bacterium]|nr:glycosyltransferase family 2 protein [Lachnospiraceae bacterium]